MPKGSIAHTKSREEEIINACEELYKTMSFRDITIKEIGNVTSFTRTSIYNYFHTKEEIFLGLLKRQYELWVSDLKDILDSHDSMSRDDFAKALAGSLEKREQMLKLLSMNIYDMESNSREEKLVEFKLVYKEVINTISMCMEKFFADMTKEDIESFIYNFFPFMFGIYPYTDISVNQRLAMDKAEVKFKELTIYEITYGCIRKLLVL